MKKRSLMRESLTRFIFCVTVLLLLATPLFYLLTKNFYAEDMIDIIEAMQQGAPVPAIDLEEDILHGLMIQFALIAGVLGIAIVLTLRFISKRLWQPFDKTLQAMETFRLESGMIPAFPDSNIKEFVQLNSGLNKLMADCEGKPENNLIQMVALRAMMKAKYSVHNIGHFGLAFEYYTHFTSPIRRYPDTMVHRLLTKYADGGRSANEKHYEELCEHCSDMEQIAQNAERDSIKYKMVEFMGDKLGEEFDAHISGITSYGIYATIDENHCEGMIPMRDIADDYYDFDEKNFCLIGRRHHNKYQLGDVIRIKVAQANLEKKQLDFTLAGDFAPVRKAKPEASTSSKKDKKSKQKTRNHRKNK